METRENCIVCDECGNDFDPSESASEKHCQDCLADCVCIVCGGEIDGENEGDEQNPLCSDCADSWMEPD